MMIKKFHISRKTFVLLFIFLVTIYGSINIFASTAYTGMRDISALDLVKEMRLGWNLGNTLDAPTETAWGNPVTTETMINKVKEMGFNTVRVPVTWDTHVGAAPDYTIDQTWLNRVEEVVNYAFDNNMYVILNLHHENSWLIPTYDNEAESTAELIKIWEQIANRFKNYGDYLIFETMNEPRVIGSSNEWTGGTYENRDVINRLNLAAVNTIRGTGGNNASRFIMVPPHAAASLDVTLNDFVIPNDDSRVIVSIHAYTPYHFAMDINGTSEWGSSADMSSLSAEFDVLYDRFVKNGRAVVIGEFGSIDKNNLSARTAHAEYYAEEASKRGIAILWWDNGYYAPGEAETYALLNRSAFTWYYSEIAEALVRGSGGTPVSTTTVYGDLDGNGEVNSIDSTLMRRYLVDIIDVFPDDDGEVAADVNGDSQINSIDYILMKRFILGKIDKFPVDNTGILYNGRFNFSDTQGPKCAWSGSNVELNFYGTQVSVTLKSTGENWFQAFVDGNAFTPFSVNSATSTVTLVSGLEDGTHKLVLWKRTEASQGEVQFLGFDFGQGKLLASPLPLERKIEYIGDSITCGYGNEGTSAEQSFTPKNENSYLSYAAITARSLNASANIIAWSGIGVAMNYGGQTGPLMSERYPLTLPYSEVQWNFRNYIPKVVVINLGTNDFSNTDLDKTEFITAYNDLVTTVRMNYPNSHIFCTVGPMLYGTNLELCRSYINEVVNGFNSNGDPKVYYLEYPTQSSSDGYGEDWHPSLITHQKMADKLTSGIKDKLGW